MKKKCLFVTSVIITVLFTGCKTVDLEMINDFDGQTKTEPLVELPEEPLHEGESALIDEPEVVVIDDGLVVVDDSPVEPEVITEIVYVEKPVYIPYSPDSEPDKRITGKDATKASEEVSIIKPENYKYGTFYYQYNENFVYEIYCQTYHLTDIILEDGEVVLGSPLISEDEAVWELTANFGINPENGLTIQHLFLKPSRTNLDSTMIIMTDRRTYHFRIKSYGDTHMAMVKFTYPGSQNRYAMTAAVAEAYYGITGNQSNNQDPYVTVSKPEFLSFDYKLVYSWFPWKKPDFLPTQVYDDGQRTYIVLPDSVLQKTLPVLFNNKNEIVNYSVQGNVFIVPRLIDELTLRLDKKSVKIKKK